VIIKQLSPDTRRISLDPITVARELQKEIQDNKWRNIIEVEFKPSEKQEKLQVFNYQAWKLANQMLKIGSGQFLLRCHWTSRPGCQHRRASRPTETTLQNSQDQLTAKIFWIKKRRVPGP
jgi:hypothetical protein